MSSMKYNSPPPPRFLTAFSVVSLVFLSLFVLSFTTCDLSEDPTDGSLTFENLPALFSISYCEVSKDSAISVDFYQPRDAAYYESLIGYGVYKDDPKKITIIGSTIIAPGTYSDPYYFSTYTGSTSVIAHFYTDAQKTPALQAQVVFNNVYFSNGHATIDTTGAFFSLPKTSGAFTLVDAAEYAGKYVAALGVTKNGKALWGFGDADSAEALKAVPIGSDGKAVIPIYLIDGTQTQPIKDYSGNSADDSLMLFWFYILDNENFDASVFQNQDNVDVLAYSGTAASAITITNGKATISANANGVIKP